jgi:hypothetical protein
VIPLGAGYNAPQNEEPATHSLETLSAARLVPLGPDGVMLLGLPGVGGASSDRADPPTKRSPTERKRSPTERKRRSPAPSRPMSLGEQGPKIQDLFGWISPGEEIWLSAEDLRILVGDWLRSLGPSGESVLRELRGVRILFETRESVRLNLYFREAMTVTFPSDVPPVSGQWTGLGLPGALRLRLHVTPKAVRLDAPTFAQGALRFHVKVPGGTIGVLPERVTLDPESGVMRVEAQALRGYLRLVAEARLTVKGTGAGARWEIWESMRRSLGVVFWPYFVFLRR